MPGDGGLVANIWQIDSAKLAEMGIDRQARIIPSPLARAPCAHSFRLVGTKSGFEGELWQQNELVASRWWKNRPDARAWARFVEGVRGRCDENTIITNEPPAPVAPEWLNKLPYAPFGWHQEAANINPAGVFAALMLALAFPAGYVVTQFSILSVQESRLHSQLETARERAAPWIATRQEALQRMRRAQQSIRVADQLSLMEAFERITAALGESEDIVLERFSFSNRTIRLRASGISEEAAPAVVRELENHPLLSDVRFDARQGELVATWRAPGEDAS